MPKNQDDGLQQIEQQFKDFLEGLNNAFSKGLEAPNLPTPAAAATTTTSNDKRTAPAPEESRPAATMNLLRITRAPEIRKSTTDELHEQLMAVKAEKRRLKSELLKLGAKKDEIKKKLRDSERQTTPRP